MRETWEGRLGGLGREELPGGLRLFRAVTARARARGLAGLEALPPDVGLLLSPCRSVHTAGMRFGLDLLWLDGHGEVVRVDEATAPRRARTCLRARAVIETVAGSGADFSVALSSGALTDFRSALTS